MGIGTPPPNALRAASTLPGVELPSYLCHKTVRAAKIKRIIHPMQQASQEARVEGRTTLILLLDDQGGVKSHTSVDVNNAWMTRNPTVEAGGYYVVYEDGYTSYSPAKALEEGYAPTATLLDDPFRTTYRALNEDEQKLLVRIKLRAAFLFETIPAGSREFALASTKLEECVMWAVKGVTG